MSHGGLNNFGAGLLRNIFKVTFINCDKYIQHLWSLPAQQPFALA